MNRGGIDGHKMQLISHVDVFPPSGRSLNEVVRNYNRGNGFVALQLLQLL